MKKYLLRQIFAVLPILLGVTLLTFCLLHFSAEDAADMLYRQHGAVSEAVKAQTRADLGLDRPLYEQYFTWLLNLLSGNAGTSYISGVSVSSLFLNRLPTTLLLAAASLLTALCISLPAGFYCALKHNKKADYLLQLLSFAGSSVPGFLLALLLIYFFSVRLQTAAVLNSSDSITAFILPTITLAVPVAAKYTRYIRGEVLREMQQPYVYGALLRGMPKNIILKRYILHAIGLNMITVVAMSAGSLLGGTAIVESIFMLNGIGRLTIEAITMKDYPVLQACIIWSTLIFILLNLAAELLCSLLDPRNRISAQERL